MNTYVGWNMGWGRHGGGHLEPTRALSPSRPRPHGSPGAGSTVQKLRAPSAFLSSPSPALPKQTLRTGRLASSTARLFSRCAYKRRGPWLGTRSGLARSECTERWGISSGHMTGHPRRLRRPPRPSVLASRDMAFTRAVARDTCEKRRGAIASLGRGLRGARIVCAVQPCGGKRQRVAMVR